MDKVDISVIVPIYNAETYLEKCLSSLQRQKEPCLEFVLVDDGSRDESNLICRKFQKEDSRFILIEKENGGSASARNKGIEEARGEYYAFVDSDDYIDNNYFKEQYENVKRNNADILVSSYICEYPCNKEIKKLNLETGIYSNEEYQELLKSILSEDVSGKRNIPSALWGKLFRNDLLRSNYKRVDEKIRMGEDLIIFLNCCCDARRMYISDEPTACYHYVMHENQLTRQYDAYYETWIPYVFNNIYDIVEKKKLPEGRRQMENYILFSTWRAFANQFSEKSHSYIESKKKIKYMCTMAKYYCDIDILVTKRKKDIVKRLLVKINSPFLIYFVYKFFGHER